MAQVLSPSEISKSYRAQEGLYSALREELVFELTNALGKTDIRYHSITARVKTLSSLQAKVESKQIADPFREVPDIVGGRVVTLFLSDIDRIVTLLQSTFQCTHIDNKIDDADPRLFSYFSVHVHGTLKPGFSGTRYDAIKALPFEVQVRTIAMDAWASASHYLAYKSEADVPEDLRRDFNALSGLFYVADKHFEMFYRSRSANLKRIKRAFSRHEIAPAQPLDLDNLTQFLGERYADREQSTGSDVSDLLAQLREEGIKEIGSLERVLDEKIDAFLLYESRFPPRVSKKARAKGPPRFTATGAVRMSLSDLDLESKAAEARLKNNNEALEEVFDVDNDDDEDD